MALAHLGAAWPDPEVRERPSPTTARLSTLAGVSEHLDSQRGRRRQPEVVRECLGWGAFATVVVPAVLILTGAEITTVALGAGVVAAVTAAVFIVVRLTRLSLPQLGPSEAVDAPAPHQPEPPDPAWIPDTLEADQFYPAPEQTWPSAPVGPTWHEQWDTGWNDEPARIPDGPMRQAERTEYDTAAPAPYSAHTPPQPPWLLPAEPICPAVGPYPETDDERMPWEHDRGFAEVYEPPEPWLLPEPRVDQNELHPAEQRGRHRRGS